MNTNRVNEHIASAIGNVEVETSPFPSTVQELSEVLNNRC